MAIDINIPSQVRTFANLAAFPASGALKTIYIAEDTNKTYRWTGSVYVEVSAAGASGITIGTTAITSGTVGRVLFEGTGNVVQESANLFWDNTNGRLGVGTSSPSGNIDINANFATTGYPLIVKNTGYFNAFFQGTSANNQASFYLENDRGSTLSYGGFAIGGSTSTLGNIFGLTRPDRLFMFADGTNNVGYAIGTLQNVPLQFGTNNAIRATVFGNGNVAINTTTDAGFRLDVNGTARFKDTGSNSSIVMNYATGGYIAINNASASETIRLRAGGGASWFNTGQNVLIGTTTDAGFRLDVNGTARVNTLTIGLGTGQVATNTVIGLTALNANTTGNQTTAIGNQSLNRNTTGNANVSVGSQSMLFNLTGELNTVVGTNALLNNSTGSSNTAIGLGVSSGNFSGSVILGREATATANNQFVVGSTGTNAGSVTTETNTSTQVWNVVINGVARKILLA